MCAARPLLELLDRYQARDGGEAADLDKTRELAASSADPWLRTTPLHVTGSALIVHPPSGRVLLRWHQRQQGWLQVGGHGDPGETDPLAIALREAAEESGLADLTPWPDADLHHVSIVNVTPSATEPAHQHADIRFLLATATPDTVRPENPDAPLRWLTVPEALDLTANPSLRAFLHKIAPLLA